MRTCTMPAVLGVTCLLLLAANTRAEEPAYMIGLKGVQNAEGQIAVLDVLKDGPADRAGIVAGDLLIEADGKALDQLPQLHDAVNRSEGRALSLTVLHDGRRRVATVQPVPRSDAALLGREAEQAMRGRGLSELLKSFPAADLLNLDKLDVEIRRRGEPDPLRSHQLPPAWNEDRDAITIYGRIRLGQLLSGLWSDGREEEIRRLQQRVETLQREVDQLKQRLDER